VFVLTVVFGLFHGLLLLPVILSMVGPAGQEKSDTDIDSIGSRDTDNSDYNNDTSDGDDDRGLDNRAFQPEVSLENQNFYEI
jgi:hypothetical protein